jgi:hypothetical protein
LKDGQMGGHEDIDAFRDYANVLINFNIFGQSVPPLQMFVPVTLNIAKTK